MHAPSRKQYLSVNAISRTEFRSKKTGIEQDGDVSLRVKELKWLFSWKRRPGLLLHTKGKRRDREYTKCAQTHARTLPLSSERP